MLAAKGEGDPDLGKFDMLVVIDYPGDGMYYEWRPGFTLPVDEWGSYKVQITPSNFASVSKHGDPMPVLSQGLKDFEGLYIRGDFFWGIDRACLDNVRVTRPGTVPVPEPGTLCLMGLGLIGIAGFYRKRQFKK